MRSNDLHIREDNALWDHRACPGSGLAVAGAAEDGEASKWLILTEIMVIIRHGKDIKTLLHRTPASAVSRSRIRAYGEIPGGDRAGGDRKQEEL